LAQFKNYKDQLNRACLFNHNDEENNICESVVTRQCIACPK
jgi:hypothetical protein